MKLNQVIIVGAGPAGLAAAIQLKRYGIQSLIFEKELAGGLLRNANLVENYPGFPGGIAGPRLVDLFLRQAEQCGVQTIFEEILHVDLEEGHFIAQTSRQRYYSRTIIVASGTSPKRHDNLLIPDELHHRVCYEVYPLLGEMGKSIAIIGAGDAAFDYGLNLARQNHVIILNRGKEIKCLPLLWERSQLNPQIDYCAETTITQALSHPDGGFLLECSNPHRSFELFAHYLLIAIGREAYLGLLSENIMAQRAELEEQGLLHFIGDVKRGLYRQTSIAVGDGVLAAMKIYGIKE